MKVTGIMLTFLLVLCSGFSHAEPGRTLASTLEVYAYPKQGQSASQQSQDEAACYDWATGNTGIDPFDIRKDADEAARLAEAGSQPSDQSRRGAGARGALAGAATGAVVGEIVSDDAGDGAAIGAATGLIAARRHARREAMTVQAEAEVKAETQAQERADQVGQFRKAFTICLEARDYLVRY